ncbi:hypothetical protein STAS_34953 [Striga asiatica]|uniref:Uncharacterized protein n=1 Tax=Striga asiatica TaxID=4170 RepID=A0A5A7RJ18_STRAF|nr:hypothetical protein STAS_34953 [Striga asiatica]
MYDCPIYRELKTLPSGGGGATGGDELRDGEAEARVDVGGVGDRVPEKMIRQAKILKKVSLNRVLTEIGSKPQKLPFITPQPISPSQSDPRTNNQPDSDNQASQETITPKASDKPPTTPVQTTLNPPLPIMNTSPHINNSSFDNDSKSASNLTPPNTTTTIPSPPPKQETTKPNTLANLLTSEIPLHCSPMEETPTNCSNDPNQTEPRTTCKKWKRKPGPKPNITQEFSPWMQSKQGTLTVAKALGIIKYMR